MQTVNMLDANSNLSRLVGDYRLSRLSAKARELILVSGHTIWVSAATVGEISIKRSLGRGGMPVSGGLASELLSPGGIPTYRLLAVEPEHAAAIEVLPGHHQDPFDRLLVAQALSEAMCLVTHDGRAARYGEVGFFV
jgi:PIN domain nuclease of toxin-antitoxin system